MTPAKSVVTSVDEYLAPLSAPQRAALEKLRRDILAAAPGAEETISYGIPTFRLAGRALVSFGAARSHCAFYPGARPIVAHEAELAGYSTGKGTIRFPSDSPLPARLVHKLVRTRIAERTSLREGAKPARARRVASRKAASG